MKVASLMTRKIKIVPLMTRKTMVKKTKAKRSA